LEGVKFEQEGVVTNYVSLSSFLVNGVMVNASAAEVTGTIANNAQVEVEGVIRGGVLIATKVENKGVDDGVSGETNLRGAITGLNAAASTFQLGGMTVTWDSNTEFDDLTASVLANGMTVEVEGIASGSSLRATKIKQDD
jgi:hypothetical protein